MQAKKLIAHKFLLRSLSDIAVEAEVNGMAAVGADPLEILISLEEEYEYSERDDSSSLELLLTMEII